MSAFTEFGQTETNILVSYNLMPNCFLLERQLCKSFILLSSFPLILIIIIIIIIIIMIKQFLRM